MTQVQDEVAPGMAESKGELRVSVPPPAAKAMLAALREVVRRAWRTLATLGDPDLHFFRLAVRRGP